MNPYLKQLQQIATKKKRTIIGLMSGTSLDGLDIALCEIEGFGFNTRVKLKHFETLPYPVFFKNQVLSIFAKPQINFETLCLLHAYIAHEHAGMLNTMLKQWKVNPQQVDLIASHGQTVFHAPKHQHQKKAFANATLQIGDGDHIAVKTGIITISDFRQKHIAAGGEGAPLAAYGDSLIFTEKGKDVLLLNIGGIANFTCLHANGKITSSDTGPGNILMDGWIKENYKGHFYDKNAGKALKGKLNTPLLNALKADAYFKLKFPKTTGPEVFNTHFVQKALAKSKTLKISPYDILATLNRFTAETISDAFQQLKTGNNTKLYVSGGGIHNPLLMQHLRQLNPHLSFHSTLEKNINPDAKEAVLFALLANETVCGATSVFKKAGPGFPAIRMGKISLPA